MILIKSIMKKAILNLFLMLISFQFLAQVGINTTLPNAQLDIRSSNQASPSNNDGILIPKVDVFPSTNPTLQQDGMLVYLTTTTGAFVPGFYYWNNATTSWKPIAGGNFGTLDQAYDFGGAGLGKTIVADSGPLTINGLDGILSAGTFGSGSTIADGSGSRMFWYPKRAAFRVGYVSGTQWNDPSVGNYSVALGSSIIASGTNSFSGGYLNSVTNTNSVSLGFNNTSSGINSTTLGNSNIASGSNSTALGIGNAARSFGETVLGIGATNNTTTTGGNTLFRSTNALDRLFVVGNAIDANSNSAIDDSERSNAITILKNGDIGIGLSNPRTKIDILDTNKVTAANGKGNLNIMTSNDAAIDIGGSLTFGGYDDSPGTVLRVFGSIEGRKINAFNSNSSGYLQFKTNNSGALSEAMRILSNGNVGIGTTNPLGKFEISVDQGRKPGTNTWTIPSDKRLKTINGNYTKGLKEIVQLNPIVFQYKNNKDRKFEQKVSETQFSGFIAQEVQPIFPDAVGTDADGFLNFNIHPILIAQVNAIKELNIKNSQLEVEKEELKLKIKKHEQKMNSILEKIKILEKNRN